MENITSSSGVGENVREAMKRSSRTQTDLAELLSLSQGAISARIRGHVDFRVDELRKVGDLLGVSIADLLQTPAPAASGDLPQPEATPSLPSGDVEGFLPRAAAVTGSGP